MPSLLILLTTLVFAAAQDVQIQPVSYEQGGIQFEGRLVLPKNAKHLLPAIALMPDWMGMTSQADAYALRVAKWGYAVFIVDLYGKGAQPKSAKEAGKLAGDLKEDVLLLRQRAIAALAALNRQKGVDTSREASMGFCFGGLAALELARSGAWLKGTVSIHGNLVTPFPRDAKNIHGKVLVLQGAEDPYATQAEALNFMDEARVAEIDWQVMFYGGAVHAFTNPLAGTDPKQGVAYDEKADRRAFALMKDFFAETL
jgi:dienelactone hydrolase